ncbi:hypothetical protein EJ02DRAFT_466012 [Clathrospora elynae]|uniref:Uncharacterized protein n=1 Tax=Clathrospora elynae TaxID=706981 RepID=A0A6A5SQW1_9PLEO|nr:hypothetical protein EJ02DRAFT_466012 [Clathrospora elynae]
MDKTILILLTATFPSLATLTFFFSLSVFFRTYRLHQRTTERIRNAEEAVTLLIESFDPIFNMVGDERRRTRSLTYKLYETWRRVEVLESRPTYSGPHRDTDSGCRQGNSRRINHEDQIRVNSDRSAALRNPRRVEQTTHETAYSHPQNITTTPEQDRIRANAYQAFLRAINSEASHNEDATLSSLSFSATPSNSALPNATRAAVPEGVNTRFNARLPRLPRPRNEEDAPLSNRVGDSHALTPTDSNTNLLRSVSHNGYDTICHTSSLHPRSCSLANGTTRRNGNTRASRLDRQIARHEEDALLNNVVAALDTKIADCMMILLLILRNVRPRLSSAQIQAVIQRYGAALGDYEQPHGAGLTDGVNGDGHQVNGRLVNGIHGLTNGLHGNGRLVNGITTNGTQDGFPQNDIYPSFLDSDDTSDSEDEYSRFGASKSDNDSDSADLSTDEIFPVPGTIPPAGTPQDWGMNTGYYRRDSRHPSDDNTFRNGYYPAQNYNASGVNHTNSIDHTTTTTSSELPNSASPHRIHLLQTPRPALSPHTSRSSTLSGSTLIDSEPDPHGDTPLNLRQRGAVEHLHESEAEEVAEAEDGWWGLREEMVRYAEGQERLRMAEDDENDNDVNEAARGSSETVANGGEESSDERARGDRTASE